LALGSIIIDGLRRAEGNDGTAGSFCDYGLGIEPSSQALTAPKLHRIAVHESLGPCYLGPCDSLVVVDANECPEPHEMTVVVDSERPIFCHALTIWFGGTETTFTDDAEARAVMWTKAAARYIIGPFGDFWNCSAQ